MRIQDMPEFQDKSEVLSFDEETTLCDAIDAMVKKGYGAVVVTSNGKLSGIFTERDLLNRVAGCRLELQGLKLKDVMTRNVKTAVAGDNITDSLRRMSQGRFRHLPVVDDTGTVLGMLSQGDFLAFTMSDIAARLSMVARANAPFGNTSLLSMLAVIFIYTLGLLFILSGFQFWFGE